MILEGIVTTKNADGTPNIAPMGPIVDAEFHRLILRPFQTSTTFQNLLRTREGVFHVTDNVEMLALAAIGRLEPLPLLTRVPLVDGWSIDDACRWYAFKVISVDLAQPRAEMHAEVVASGRLRDYWGLNRAKHAIVELAILATRLQIVPPAEVVEQLRHYSVLVEKTGGAAERRALALLEDYMRENLPSAAGEEIGVSKSISRG